jgi:parallel beta-helix repeat protein
MKIISQGSFIALTATAFVIFNVATPTAFAQGSLTPPGPPAPTMKTLDQVEPRTPVDLIHTPAGGYGVYAITNPGSYYLTTNIAGVSGTYGIEIMTNHVTLDLNGFALTGGGLGAAGVDVAYGANDVTVRNGSISGFADGVDSEGFDTVLDNLRITGCSESAIYFFYSPSVVRNCLCDSNGVSLYSPGVAINGGVISGCTILNSGGDGLDFYGNGGTVSDCVVSGSHGYGISASGSNAQILGNTLNGNTYIAILMNGNNNRIEGNHVITPHGTVGIEVAGSEDTNNIVIRNTVSGNGASNYSNPGNNDFGPIGTAATATSPWANISH